MRNENRFRMVERSGVDRWRRLVEAAQKEVDRRTGLYQRLAAISPAAWGAAGPESSTSSTNEPEKSAAQTAGVEVS
jgi:hypothetical protein